MDINKFVKVNMSLEGPAALAAEFSVILFLADVTADDVRNWEPGQVIKEYAAGEIDNDFPSTSRAYKFADAVFKQNPVVDTIKIGRRDPDQSVADALNVIESKDQAWYALAGSRGLTDILSGANWIESRRKMHFVASYDADIPTTSDQSIAAILNNLGFQRTVLFYNNQPGYQFPTADLGINVTDGVAEVTVSNAPQTSEVSVDAVVEDFTYSIQIVDTGIDETVSYTTGEYYNKQIDKITVLQAENVFTYRLTIAGVSVTFVSDADATKEEIKNGLKAAVNADLVLQQKMSAIDDTEGDTSSLRLIGQEEYISYEVLVGQHLLRTPLTMMVAPTQSDIAAELHSRLLENEVINADYYLTITGGGEVIQISAKDPLEIFTLTLSANLTETAIVFDYGFQIGDPLTVFGADDLKLNGNAFITEVPAPDKFKFDTNATNVVGATGNILIDWNFVYPDAALAGWGLAHPNGALDWAHTGQAGSIIGVRPEDDQYLTSEVVSNLEANNVNWFHVTAGKRLFWQGRVINGLFIDIVIDGLDYLPTRMEEAVFNFLTSLPKVPMSDASLGGLKAQMDQVLEIEGKQRGITAPFIEDRVRYPDTGFPPGARPGDHYVSRVPRVRDIPLADRQNRRITSGIEFEFQTAGGIHVLVISGTLKQ